MTALFLLALLQAAPKPCKTDLVCFEELAKKCEPVEYRWEGTQKLAGTSATGSTSYVVKGKKNGACVVEYANVLQSAAIDPELLKAMLPDAGPDELAAFAKKLVADGQKAPEKYTCDLDPAEVVAWVKGNLPNHADFGSDRYAKCTPADCGPKPKLAAGCSYGACGHGGWHFRCGPKKLECVVETFARYPDNCSLSCTGEPGKTRVDETCH